MTDRLNWTDEMLADIAALLVDQRRTGNCGDNGLKPQGVENETKQLRAKYGETITKDKVKSCVHQKLKPQYTTFKKLRANSGFGWNKEKKQVTAPVGVWDSYIRDTDREARRFRDKGFPIFDLLDEFFSGSVATGRHATSSRAAPGVFSDSEEEAALDAEVTAEMLVESATVPPSDTAAGATGTTSGNQPADPPKKKRKTRNAGMMIAAALQAMNEQYKKEVDAMTGHEKAIKLLQEAYKDTLTNQGLVAAIKILADEKNARTFCTLEEGTLRDLWLESELRALSVQIADDDETSSKSDDETSSKSDED